MKLGGVYNRHVLYSYIVAMIYLSISIIVPIVMIQTTVFIDLVIQGFATFSQYMRLVGHSILFSFPIAFPLVQAFAITFVIKTKQNNGEIAALASAGASPYYLALPALAVATCGTMIMAAFCFYLEPINNRAFYQLRDNLTPTVPQHTPPAKTFLTFPNDVAIYYEDQEEDGSLRGILIHDGRDKQRSVTIVAQRGYMDAVREGYSLNLYAGSYQVQEGVQAATLKDFQNMSFLLVITPAKPTPSKTAWLRANERFLPDLLFPNMGEDLDRKHQVRLVAYGHQLIVRTIFTLLLAVGATITAMRFTSLTRGDWPIYIVGAVGLTTYFGVFWAESIAAENNASPLIIYLPAFVIVALNLPMVGHLLTSNIFRGSMFIRLLTVLITVFTVAGCDSGGGDECKPKCSQGKACGDTCIQSSDTCHVGPGSAC
jgi:lipopolysaccharide export system permease protein